MRPAGLEPAAYWFEASRSIQLSYGRAQAEKHSTCVAPGDALIHSRPIPMPAIQQVAAFRELVPLMFVQDITRALAFYQQLGFGITASWEPDGKRSWCRLERGSAAIMLQQAEEEDGPPEGRGRGVEFFFNCDEADAVYADLVSHGIPVKPPVVAFYGMKQLFLKNPDGYQLCFQSLVAETPQ